MRTGSIQVFQYEIGGNQFQVHPWSTGEDELEATTADASFGATATPVDSGGGVSLSMQVLPENVMFISGETLADTRSAVVESGDSAGMASTGVWGTPIVFYPDGTTSTAQLIMANTREQHIRLDLRGLTGIATVSDTLSIDEVMQ